MCGERDLGEAGGFEQRAKLSFQESAGNSAGPETDVLFGALRHRFADDDIGHL